MHLPDPDVDHVGRDQRGAEVDALLCGTALAVDRGCGGLDREPGLEPGGARDVERLLGDLLHAAGHHIVHQKRVDASSTNGFCVDRAEQHVWVEVAVHALFPVSAPDWDADGFYDHGFTAAHTIRHENYFLPNSWLKAYRVQIN